MCSLSFFAQYINVKVSSFESNENAQGQSGPYCARLNTAELMPNVPKKNKGQ